MTDHTPVLTHRHLSPAAELTEAPSPATTAAIHKDLVWQQGGQLHGTWQMQPGVLPGVEGPESVCIITGRATVLIRETGTTHELSAGDIFVINTGETADWTIHETVRKFFVVNK